MASPKKSVVQPTIIDNNSSIKHPLQLQENSKELVSVGFAKLSDNSNSYVSYIITTKGNEVISIVVSEPNLKAIAMDEAKINFVNELMDK